jgi:predicted dehydrogenase
VVAVTGRVRRVRVAVAGLGAVAQSVHLPLLARRWDLFEVVALCDLSGSLREELGKQYGVAPHQRYGEVADLLANADADAVLLLTSGSHGEVARPALQRSLPVFCEKPLAYTLAEADRLAAAEQALGRPALLLGYMKERDQAVRRLRERLAEVDGIRAVEVRVLHPAGAAQLAFANLRPAADQVPETVAALRRQEEQLLDAALGPGTPGWFRSLYARIVLTSLVHDTSLLRVLFGGLTTVDDVQVWPEGSDRPSVEVSGGLPNGARVRMAWHYLPDYPAYHETLAVHHARGSLEVRFGTPYLLNAPTELEVVEAVPGGEVRSRNAFTCESFEAELVEFHAMVTAGIRPVAGIAEGRADILTSLRIMRRLAEQLGITVGGEAGAP